MTITPCLLPEYAPVSAVLLALPYAGGDWDNNFQQARQCYRAIVEALLLNDPDVEVWLLVKADWQAWAESLGISDADRTRLRLINTIDYNDTWTRDYGPLGVTGAQGVEFRSFIFNGWGGKYTATADTRVAACLSEEGTLPAVEDVALVLEGGALEINSQGVLLVNRDCIVDEARNPGLDDAAMAQQLRDWLGVSEIEWIADINLEGDDTDGHIDTLARFIDDQTLVYCGENSRHHDADALASLHQQLQVIARKRNWTIHGLPSPVIRSQVDGRLLPATYANFLMANRRLYLPVYGVPEDTDAVAIIAQLAPDYDIVPVRCEALLEQHGSLHCATMQIPVFQAEVSA